MGGAYRRGLGGRGLAPRRRSWWRSGWNFSRWWRASMRAGQPNVACRSHRCVMGSDARRQRWPPRQGYGRRWPSRASLTGGRSRPSTTAAGWWRQLLLAQLLFGVENGVFRTRRLDRPGSGRPSPAWGYWRPPHVIGCGPPLIRVPVPCAVPRRPVARAARRSPARGLPIARGHTPSAASAGTTQVERWGGEVCRTRTLSPSSATARSP